MQVLVWLAVGVLVVASVHLATTAVVRWADGRRLRQPWRPRCVTDTHDLSARDVIPGWSWMATRGRCRSCRSRVPGSLPLVEVGVVAVVVAVVVRHPGPELLVLAPVAWSTVVASAIDLDAMIIPDRLTYPLAAWSLAAVTLVAAGTGAWGDWQRAVVVGLAVPGIMFLLSLVFALVRGQDGIGMGDVKWALSLGIAVGWLGLDQTLGFAVATVLASGIVATILLAMGRAGTTRIPFGPYLAIGTVVGLLVPGAVVRDVLL